MATKLKWVNTSNTTIPRMEAVTDKGVWVVERCHWGNANHYELSYGRKTGQGYTHLFNVETSKLAREIAAFCDERIVGVEPTTR